MEQLPTKNLLIISPHFKLFLREQIRLTAQSFSSVTVVVPKPYFPRGLLKISCFDAKFPFLRNAFESCEQSNHRAISIVSPNFLTLPVEPIRNRAPILAAHKIVNAIKRASLKFGIVHSHRLDNGVAGAIIKDLYGIPLVVNSHGPDVYEFPFRNDFTHSLSKYVISRTDHVIAVCTSDGNKLLSLGLPRKKLSIIPNGYDDGLFKHISRDFARKELGLPESKKILLAIGSLLKVKGHDDLIDAAYILSKERKDFAVIIVGSGPLEPLLRKKIEKLELSQKILMIGWVPHNKISLWMNASDILILPSLHEGFPTVIPEAMACGLPVIGTKVGGIPDVISNENIGFLVNPGDPKALAQAILESFTKEWDSKQIQAYSQQYALRNIVRQILQVYRYVS